MREWNNLSIFNLFFFPNHKKIEKIIERKLATESESKKREMKNKKEEKKEKEKEEDHLQSISISNHSIPSFFLLR